MRVKQILKNSLSSIAGRLRDLDGMMARKCERYILAYHRILPRERTREEFIQDSMWTDPESFEHQIEWMKKMGEVVGLEDILNFTQKNDRPLFALTFDDGWKDNYEYAFPILKKCGVTATIFVVTSAVNTGRLFWPEEMLNKTRLALTNGRRPAIERFIAARLPKSKLPRHGQNADKFAECFLEHLKELSAAARQSSLDEYYTEIGAAPAPMQGSILNWNEILEMDKHGIGFGSHTHTHAILEYVDAPTALEELVTSKRTLEEKLGKTAAMFCYPNARYKKTDGELLEKAGYRFGFRLHNLPVTENDPPYFIPRILVDEKTWANRSYFKFRLMGFQKY